MPHSPVFTVEMPPRLCTPRSATYSVLSELSSWAEQGMLHTCGRVGWGCWDGGMEGTGRCGAVGWMGWQRDAMRWFDAGEEVRIVPSHLGTQRTCARTYERTMYFNNA